MRHMPQSKTTAAAPAPGAGRAFLRALAGAGAAAYLLIAGVCAVGAEEAAKPARISLASTRSLSDRVQVIWSSPPGELTSASVYRRDENGQWQFMSRIWADGPGWMVFDDTEAKAGARYGYRLGMVEEGEEIFLGETWVRVPLLENLTLAFIASPTFDRLDVAFSLPGTTPARLELFDVSGRRIASRDVGSLGAGKHTLTLADRRLPAGAYLMRLTQGAHSVTARGIILR